MLGKELYLVAENGKIQMWKAEVLTEKTKEGWGEIVATYGFTDGKLQTKSTFVKTGKNLGKKNETTIEQQTELKCEQMYADKIKSKAMVFDINDWVRPMRPSLAMAYEKRKKHLKHVDYWLADEKLDGNRAYEFNDRTWQSKSGDVITPLSHIKESIDLLRADNPDVVFDLDGENYLHGLDLQTITGICNTEDDDKRDKSILLEYHIFGIFFPNEPNLSAEERQNRLLAMFEGKEYPYLVLRKKIKLKNDEKLIYEYVKKCEDDGYEGAILLDPKAPYHHSKNTSDRNDSMIKAKNMLDQEFLIVDIVENENEVGIPKFIIELPDFTTNEVVMKGKKDDAKKYLTDKNLYIGKYLKVQFQAWTKYGKLEFPVGLEVRVGKMTEFGFDGKF